MKYFFRGLFCGVSTTSDYISLRSILTDITACIPLEVDRHFGGTSMDQETMTSDDMMICK
jgi:hypothetical protein